MKAIVFSIWVFIARFFAYWYMRIGMYQYWSDLYRFIWERKFRDVVLMTFPDLKTLIAFIGGGSRWRADSWRALWDSVSSPQRVQQVFAKIEPQPDSDFDCDDYMAFTVNAIDKSLKYSLMIDEGITTARCLTVMWIEKDTWASAGHNVTLLEYRQKTDGSTWYAFMDYAGPSGKRPDINSIAELVRTTYAGKDKYVGVAWCVSQADLTPWIANWG